MHTTAELEALLHSAGYKATPKRVGLLQVLMRSSEPLTVLQIVSKMRPAMNEVTAYRALEALTNTGLVRRVDLAHGHAHFELNVLKKHHHHLVCTNCGAIEDVEVCDIDVLKKRVLKRSAKFGSIYSHNLEFFGLCKKCSKV